LPSWRALSTQAFLIATWQKKQPAQSESAFAAAFEAEFQMPWAVWCEMKRLRELTIPEPCRDGHHVFAGDQCKYCPYIRAAAEEIA
jgi:hypothetical protein